MEEGGSTSQIGNAKVAALETNMVIEHLFNFDIVLLLCDL